MEVQELRDRKKKLEKDIAREINSLMIHFHRETRFSPSHIDVSLIDATAIGEENKVYIVDVCNTIIDI